MTKLLIPKPQVTLSHHHHMNTYHLSAIIYLSQFHFTTQLLDNWGVWHYDGQKNSGTPLQEYEIQFTNDDTWLHALTTLDGRSAHLYVYGLWGFNGPLFPSPFLHQQKQYINPTSYHPTHHHLSPSSTMSNTSSSPPLRFSCHSHCFWGFTSTYVQASLPISVSCSTIPKLHECSLDWHHGQSQEQSTCIA